MPWGRSQLEAIAKRQASRFVITTVLPWAIPAAAIAFFWIVIAFALLFFVVFVGNLFTVSLPMIPTYTGTPLANIPVGWTTYLQGAALRYRVPEQLLAGEAETESSWNPNAMSQAANSHAAGLMQFEPGTWSGSANPHGNVVWPDTNAMRIAKYGGFGVNADGQMAPDGTPAWPGHPVGIYPAPVSWVRVAFGLPGTTGAPYASPFDPADALAAGAKYLRHLYLTGGYWSQAVGNYYGGSGESVYVQTVLTNAAKYLNQTPAITTKNGLTFPFGRLLLSVRIKGNTSSVKDSSETQNVWPYAALFDVTTPIYMPTTGVVRWVSTKTHTLIILPLGHGQTLRIIAPLQTAIRWGIARGAKKASLPAGALVGFVDLGNGVTTQPSLLQVFPVLTHDIKYGAYDPALLST